MKLKPLKGKKWKKFQKFVKEQDANSTKNTLGVSFYAIEFSVDEDGKIIHGEDT